MPFSTPSRLGISAHLRYVYHIRERNGYYGVWGGWATVHFLPNFRRRSGDTYFDAKRRPFRHSIRLRVIVIDAQEYPVWGRLFGRKNRLGPISNRVWRYYISAQLLVKYLYRLTIRGKFINIPRKT